MKPSDVIVQVRVLIQDNSTPYRYSDDKLVGFINQVLAKMAVFRPDLFAVVGDIPTTPNTVVQSVPSDGIQLIDVYSVKGMTAVTEVTRETMDQSYPTWVSDPAGVPENFIRNMTNPYRYFLYPAPKEGIVLVGEYARAPRSYTVNEVIEDLRDAYLMNVVEGTIYLAESVDNEHVNSGRAKMFQDSFKETLGLSLQAQQKMNSEAGYVKPTTKATTNG